MQKMSIPADLLQQVNSNVAKRHLQSCIAYRYDLPKARNTKFEITFHRAFGCNLRKNTIPSNSWNANHRRRGRDSRNAALACRTSSYT